MRIIAPWGSRIRTLPLPGDENDVFEYMTRYAVQRDNRLTTLEFAALQCVTQELLYGGCLSGDCLYCGGWWR